MGPYRNDASHLTGAPVAVVRPADSEDVVRLVHWARASRTPLVPRGGGTSLDGESVPPQGAVVVDLSGWDAVGEIDRDSRTVRVGPGVVNYELHRALRRHGLFFPPNPGSWRTCTLGGNVATNASGPRSYRYGPTRAWVRGLEVVLGTGQRLRCGRPKVRKRSAGPELTGLFVGSEGTLGIFTELTLGLAPSPARRTGVAVRLPGPTSIVPVAAALRRAEGLRLSALELLDARCATELSRSSRGRIAPGKPTLLLEVESDTPNDDADLERLLEVLYRTPATDDPAVYPDADDLWTLRGRSSQALDAAIGPRIREDVAVPLGRLSELLGLVEALATRYATEAFVYGHLGEASLHPNFAIAPGSVRGESLRRELLDGTLALGGTISSEHGVGRVKREWLGSELGPEALGLLRAWKATCDPDGILNPGDLYPQSPEAVGSPAPSRRGAGGSAAPATGPTAGDSDRGGPAQGHRRRPRRGGVRR